ncbi:phosphomethylpyrimidine synthase ThiC [bacterium]|nr:phosphomethylpyrimidine synthase ThiC [bacterium]
MNTIAAAKKGIMNNVIKGALSGEALGRDEFVAGIIEGRIVIPRNRLLNRKLRIKAVGRPLSVKVNANIGTSPELCDAGLEKKKAKAAYEAGADFIMDLSTGGDLAKIRRMILKTVPLPLGTVPVYDAAVEFIKTKKTFLKMDAESFFKALENHAKEGVDFVTIHCGINTDTLNTLNEQKRLMGIVSRGGSITAKWMDYNGLENPYFKDFGRVIEIAEKYDITLSLGDGMRPGCIADATDSSQIHELMVLSKLAKYAHENGVQVMIEGPGHIPLNEIETNIRLQRTMCNDMPFYVLGPLVTDIAAGYDHITSAIGGALAAWHGASLLCYVTPSEHLRLPDENDVREGVLASRIAAHAADIAKGLPGSRVKDDKISFYRKKRDWNMQFEYSMDRKKAEKMRKKDFSIKQKSCTMCGKLCSMKEMDEVI